MKLVHHTASAGFTSPQIGRLARHFLRGTHGLARDNLRHLNRSLLLEEIRLPALLRLSIGVLVLATLGFIVWAALTPLKELARTEGQVLPSGYTRLVQHLEGGLVEEILAHEGDYVQKGQLLMRLNGAGTTEDWRGQEALVLALQMQGERLRAYLDGRHPDFSAFGASPAQMAEQRDMFEAARLARGSELSVIDQQVLEKQNTLSRLQQALRVSRSNLAIVGESRDMYNKLAESGYAAKLTLLKKQEDFNSSQGQVSDLAHQIDEAQHGLAEFRQRRAVTAAQQRENAYSELHKVDADLAQALEDMKKREARVGRLDVTAPVDGYVKGIKLTTIGAVVPSGQTLMEIVPADETLMVEAQIPPELVGRVVVGQPVEIKVDSYDYVRFGTIPGTLKMISATTFVDEGRRKEYYKGRIQLQRNYAGHDTKAHKVIPGMTVDADIVTGEKSILAYLLKPIRTAMSASMTEQ